jgi:Fe-S-cluster containining protein
VERVLPYLDGRCQFLGADDRCTIYEDRPVNCRRFECVTGYNHAGSTAGRHSLFLSRNPGVLKMLEDLEGKVEDPKFTAKLGPTEA